MSTIFSPIYSALTIAFMLLGSASAQEIHKPGIDYGYDGINTYNDMKHGPDGKLFLDPYFLPYLQDSQGEVLLDAGCGAGPWSVYAASHGANVYGIDIQEGMIVKAKLAALEANVQDKVRFDVGDVGQLPYPDEFFDKAISLNVGCNLSSLTAHIKELKRVLKKGGTALVTAPSSFGVVFTDGSHSSGEAIEVIRQLLLNNNNPPEMPLPIQGLDEVYRATFAYRDGGWSLVLDEEELIPGEDIWRKIPKMLLPNRYHSNEEYLSLFKSEGFYLKSDDHPKFVNETARQEYNSVHKDSLGHSYVTSSPFVIFIIEK